MQEKRLKRTPDRGAELLQEEVGGNFEQDIRNEAMIVFSPGEREPKVCDDLQDDQGRIIFGTVEIQLLLETKDGGV